MAENPPAGWYPDNNGTTRWWDGDQWTEHLPPLPAPEPGPVEPALAATATAIRAPADAAPGSTTRAGWYSDGQGRQRFWDGDVWFESVEVGGDPPAQSTQPGDAGPEPLESTLRISPGTRRNKGESRLALLLTKGPLALMVLGGIVTVIGVIALLVVDPTCLNNEDCGFLEESFWSLFGVGMMLASVGVLFAAAGFIWHRRNRLASIAKPDSAETTLVQSVLPGSRPWYRRRRGMALLALSVLIAAGIAAGLALNGGDDPSSALPKASYPPTEEPFQAEELTAEEEAAQAAEAEEEAKRQAEADARSKAELRDPKSYKSISHRKWAQVAKDPDSYVGKKYVLYGWVTQFDSATGNDSFLVSTDAVPRTSYEYDINTMATTDKPKRFRKVVEDDLVKMYVVVGGSFSYDTQIGGNTTVPSVVVNIIKVTGSAG